MNKLEFLNSLTSEQSKVVNEILEEELATQQRELLEWVRTEVEGMSHNYKGYQPGEDIILDTGYNYAIGDVLALLAQRRELGERKK